MTSPATTDMVQTGMDEQRGTHDPVTARPERPASTSRASGGEDGMMVLSYILSGILLYGGLGWLGDRWLHQAWMLPVGLICGLVASMYLIIKRFGSHS